MSKTFYETKANKQKSKINQLLAEALTRLEESGMDMVPFFIQKDENTLIMDTGILEVCHDENGQYLHFNVCLGVPLFYLSHCLSALQGIRTEIYDAPIICRSSELDEENDLVEVIEGAEAVREHIKLLLVSAVSLENIEAKMKKCLEETGTDNDRLH